MSKMLYTPTGDGNSVLRQNGCFISFRKGDKLPGNISAFRADNGSDETALVIEDDFFILNGDYRHFYAALTKDGVKACLKFFIEHAANASSWSASADRAKRVLKELKDD